MSDFTCCCRGSCCFCCSGPQCSRCSCRFGSWDVDWGRIRSGQFNDDTIFHTVWTVSRATVGYIWIEPVWWSIVVSIGDVLTFLSSHINVLVLNIASFNSEKHRKL